MSKIKIEQYRGFDIEFDTNYEKFQCVITEDMSKESNSFSAVKKFVDDYKKLNQDFKPFYIETIPSNFNETEKLKVIGIRKDGRFVSENDKGEKEQISDYSLNKFMLANPSNEPLIKEIEELNEKKKTLINEIEESKKDAISKLKIVTLEEYKRSL